MVKKEREVLREGIKEGREERRKGKVMEPRLKCDERQEMKGNIEREASVPVIVMMEEK